MFAKNCPVVLENYEEKKKKYICDPFLRIYVLGMKRFGFESSTYGREVLRDRLIHRWFWSFHGIWLVRKI